MLKLSENADLNFIWAVLNICLKHLSSSIWLFWILVFIKEWNIEIEKCAIDFFVYDFLKLFI